MKRSSLIASSVTPDGSKVGLYEHDGQFSIRVDGQELMSTRQHSSEEALATLSCVRIREKKNARVLIGGLGFGFTLRAALAVLAPSAKIIVSEILPAVIEWNRVPEFKLAFDVMEDPRVEIVNDDVNNVIRQERAGFDAIMLDVDNGPAAMTTLGNKRLYDPSGLAIAQGALLSGGCLAFWSAAASPRFEKLLKKAGFEVKVERVKAYKNAGSWHTIYLARVR